MVIKLYGVLSSPPVRASMLTLNALKLSYEFVEIDFRNKQHLSPEFLEVRKKYSIESKKIARVYSSFLNNSSR